MSTESPAAVPVLDQEKVQSSAQLSDELSNSNTGIITEINNDSTPPNMASIAEGGRELSKNILYVGNISKTISNEALIELFSSLGNPFKGIKILQDKNKPGFNYAFVEYEDPEFATTALNSLNNTIVGDNQLKITFAFQTQQIKNIDTFNLFIGDLSLEVNDDILNKAFAKYNSLVQANVMWDMKTGRSRGYGFVCFNDKNDAIDALQTMSGYTLGDRQIKLNWASHKERNNNNNIHNHNNQNNNHNHNHNNNHINNQIKNGNYNQYYFDAANGNHNNNNINNSFNNGNNGYYGNENNTVAQNQGMMNFPINNGMMVNNNNGNDTTNVNKMNVNDPNVQQLDNQGRMMIPPSYEMVLRQAPSWLSVVYLGNLAEYTTQNDLIPILQNFGYIVNFKILPSKGCAFVTYDTHDRAALAIVQLAGLAINGRPLKCGWGKSARAPLMQNNMQGNIQQAPRN